MSESELSDTHRKIVETAVRTTLLSLGLDVSDPDSIIQMQRDFQHLRKWRQSVETIESKSLMVVIGTLLAGGLAAAWIGITNGGVLPR